MPARLQELSWDDVRVLLALSREGTLARAGAALGVNASTVARRLSALERALGTRLFNRTSDGTQPTAAAERLLPYAERIEHAAAELLQANGDVETKPAGVVRVSAPPGLAEYFVAPMVAALAARYPGLAVEIVDGRRALDLTRGEADIALMHAAPTAGDHVGEVLPGAPDALLASPALVERLGPLTSLADASFITWGAQLAHLPAARWIAANVPSERVVLRTSSICARIVAAQQSAGIVLLPERYAEACGLAPVRLIKKLGARLPPTPREPLWLVGHRALADVPRVAVVWQTLAEQFARPGALPRRTDK